MPCGQYKKSKIREIAKEIGLRVHNKKIVKKYALYQIMIMEGILKIDSLIRLEKVTL